MNKVAPWARSIHPYPLSEKYFLVSAQIPSTADGKKYQAKFGIYLVDVFDNIVPLVQLPLRLSRDRRAVGPGRVGRPVEMVLVPSGEFVMGDPDGADDERPATRVRIDRPFWMSRCEITNRQFQKFEPGHDSRMERIGFLH